MEMELETGNGRQNIDIICVYLRIIEHCSTSISIVMVTRVFVYYNSELVEDLIVSPHSSLSESGQMLYLALWYIAATTDCFLDVAQLSQLCSNPEFLRCLVPTTALNTTTLWKWLEPPTLSIDDSLISSQGLDISERASLKYTSA